MLKKQLAREMNRNVCGENNRCTTIVMFSVPNTPSPLSLYSIRSILESRLDQKNLPPLLGLEVLPEDITLGQGADVWRAAVKFKRR